MYKIYTSTEIESIKSYLLILDSNFSVIPNATYYTIEKKDKIIGYACISSFEDFYLFENIFIDETLRYKSFGSKLLFFIFHKLSNKKELCAYNNVNTDLFFKKNGFKANDKGFLSLDSFSNNSNRKNEARKTILSSIFWNIILAVLKITAGLFGKSKALLADGFNSLSDTFTSFGILLGVYFSNIPEDEDHPFGHEKIESVIGVVLGIFMCITAFEITKTYVDDFFTSKEFVTPSFSTIYFAGFSSIVKFFMYRQKLRVGEKTKNAALIADAKDSRNDVFSSLGVILGILLSIYINPMFDTIMGIAVAGLIFKEGISVILETTHTILDRQDPQFIQEIEAYVYENTNITNVHDIAMRTSGDKIFLTLHIRVPKDMSVYHAHKIADNLEMSITEDFDEVKEVVIHLDYLIES